MLNDDLHNKSSFVVSLYSQCRKTIFNFIYVSNGVLSGGFCYFGAQSYLVSICLELALQIGLNAT